MAFAADTGELTLTEMQDILRRRIWRAHRMSVDDYFKARAEGKIALGPADASIEVFAGDCASELKAARAD